MLRVIKGFNSGSSFSAICGEVKLYVHAVNGRMWATVSRDPLHQDQVCAFRRHSLPLIHDRHYSQQEAMKEFPEFMQLFAQ